MLQAKQNRQMHCQGLAKLEFSRSQTHFSTQSMPPAYLFWKLENIIICSWAITCRIRVQGAFFFQFKCGRHDQEEQNKMGDGEEHQKLFFFYWLCACRQVLDLSPATETEVFLTKNNLIHVFIVFRNYFLAVTSSNQFHYPCTKLNVNSNLSTFLESFNLFFFGHDHLFLLGYFHPLGCFLVFVLLFGVLCVWVLVLVFLFPVRLHVFQ